MLDRSTRPPRGEIDRAALELLARHSAQILATARRYSANAEDAEDAYQRALEILLTKAPTTREEELVPWLKTVVKHEAFALRRQAERLTPVTGDGEPVERGTAPAATHDQAERYERLRQGAEALGRLKPQEVRCLVLKAQGLSYREICEATGFTYTKVNRCLTEGRQALTVRMAGIEGGIECARLAPLLSALADGEADAEALAVLRPHMKTCLSCRARLKEFRAAPARVAGLVPAAMVAGGPGARGLLESVAGALQQKVEGFMGAAQQKAEGILAATHHKAAALGERTQAAVELATGQKVAAVAASAAVLAGGGTAVDHFARHEPPHRSPAEQSVEAKPVKQEVPVDPAPAPVPVAEEPVATEPAPAPEPEPPPPPPPPPDPANEFDPTAAAAPAPEPASPPVAPKQPTGGGFSPGGAGPSGGGGGSEFGP